MPNIVDISQLMRSEWRCIVCGLAMPRGDDGDVCSQRCASRRQIALELHTNQRKRTEEDILSVVDSLRVGTTICPGELSQKILPETEDPLRLLRPLIFSLQEEKRLRLSQKGVITPWRKIRGPFRVGRVK